MTEVLVVYYEHNGSSAGMHILDRMPENEEELNYIFDEILCIPKVYKDLLTKGSTNFERMKQMGYWQFSCDENWDDAQIVYFSMKKVNEL